MDWYFIEKDEAHISRERKKARELKKSNWWQNKLSEGLCHYCGSKFNKSELTMDHVVPVSRGGLSNKSNVVVSCKACNLNKKIDTPVDLILEKLSKKENQ